jgi:DNA-binding transcriptional LysR family regulator
MTLIAFANGCSYRKRLEEWLGGAAVMPARTLEFASYQAMIACVAAGTGFAIVPRSLLVALKAAQDVRQHELPAKVRRKNHTHLVWNGAPSTALQRLQALLADCSAAPPAGATSFRQRWWPSGHSRWKHGEQSSGGR